MARPQERATQSISSDLSPLVRSPPPHGSPGGRRTGSVGVDGSERVISPRGSVLREERARLLEAAKHMGDAIQESEVQAREQEAVAQIIREELRAKTPRITGPSSREAQHADSDAEKERQQDGQEPATQRALLPQMQMDGPGHSVPAGRRQKTAQDRPGSTSRSPQQPVANLDAGDDKQGRRPGAHTSMTSDGQEPAGKDRAQKLQLDAGVQGLLETESQVLLIMQFSVSGGRCHSVMRTDLTRSDLLQVCRNDIDPAREQSLRSSISKSTSVGQLAELKRDLEPSDAPRGSPAAGVDAARQIAMSGLPNLHLRDLRYLQGTHDDPQMTRAHARALVACTHRKSPTPLRVLSASLLPPDGALCVCAHARYLSVPVSVSQSLSLSLSLSRSHSHTHTWKHTHTHAHTHTHTHTHTNTHTHTHTHTHIRDWAPPADGALRGTCCQLGAHQRGEAQISI